MRAAAIESTGTADVLRIMDVAAPLRIESEVLVKVVAAGVSPLDVLARAGHLPASVLGGFPAVLGYDFSGIVIEAPYGAHPLQPGDEVYGVALAPRGPGSYAEYVSVPSTHTARKPTRLSHVEAAAVPLAALAAWGMVIDVGKAHEGQIVLVHAGAGGVGHLAVQFAAHFGAHVIATGSARNASWLRELGAMEVIDYESSRFEDLAVDVDLVIDLDSANILRAVDALTARGLRPLLPVPARDFADETKRREWMETRNREFRCATKPIRS